MLWRQLGWLKSVLASKFGADCNLLWSPANTKLGCCCELLALVLLEAAELPAPPEDALNSIQGTTTCFPPATEVEELIPVLLAEVLPAVELELPAAPPETEITANSSRPDAGLIIVSLMVPISLPDELLTCAPVSWLPRTGSCAMRPVALMRPAHPEGLAAEPLDVEPGVALLLPG